MVKTGPLTSEQGEFPQTLGDTFSFKSLKQPRGISGVRRRIGKEEGKGSRGSEHPCITDAYFYLIPGKLVIPVLYVGN